MNFSDYTLGEHIKTARIKKGFSQEAFAEMLDITPTHVKHMESGHRKPSVDILFKIAQQLDMSIDNVIFTDTEDVIKKASINEINNLLTKCSNSELAIVSDLIVSLLKNK